LIDLEPELSQKTFLRREQEMPKLLKHSKKQEQQQRPTERPLEPSLKQMLKSTSTSTKLPIPHSLKLREMPRPVGLFMLKVSQRLLLLSELEGKLKFYLILFKLNSFPF